MEYIWKFPLCAYLSMRKTPLGLQRFKIKTWVSWKISTDGTTEMFCQQSWLSCPPPLAAAQNASPNVTPWGTGEESEKVMLRGWKIILIQGPGRRMFPGITSRCLVTIPFSQVLLLAWNALLLFFLVLNSRTWSSARQMLSMNSGAFSINLVRLSLES